MAQEFPHVEVWGMDHTNHRRTEALSIPTNCRFIAWDLKSDISIEHRSSFDVIHMRTAAGGVSIT